MKRAGLYVFLGLLATILVVPNFAAPATSTVSTVENYSLSGTVAVDLPGHQTAGGTLFKGTVTLNDTDFSRGSMTAQGSSFELAGAESSFGALSYNFSAVVPAASGPATVDVAAKVSANQFGTNWFSAKVNVENVALGSEFSANYLDLGVGQEAVNVMAANVSSAQNCAAAVYVAAAGVPDVDVRVEQTQSSATTNVLSIDAANGLVDFAGLGQITVDRSGSDGGGLIPGISGVVTAPTIPPAAGLGLLLLGLGFALALGVQRRQQVATTALA